MEKLRQKGAPGSNKRKEWEEKQQALELQQNQKIETPANIPSDTEKIIKTMEDNINRLQQDIVQVNSDFDNLKSVVDEWRFLGGIMKSEGLSDGAKRISKRKSKRKSKMKSKRKSKKKSKRK